jgi:hypothetical protein
LSPILAAPYDGKENHPLEASQGDGGVLEAVLAQAGEQVGWHGLRSPHDHEYPSKTVFRESARVDGEVFVRLRPVG